MRLSSAWSLLPTGRWQWAAASPFLYFADHVPELGRLVTEGRRNEFGHFSSFSSPEAAARIPDPQAASTFERSRLDWSERARPEHADVLGLYKRWLGLRSTLAPVPPGGARALALDADTIAVSREGLAGETLWLVVRLRGHGRVELPEAIFAPGPWRVVLDTERPDLPAAPPALLTLDFPGPGAVLLSAAGPPGAQEREGAARVSRSGGARRSSS